MLKVEAKKRIAKLKKLIDKYRYQYHVLNKLEISDEALDSLKHELKKLEDEFPALITSDSPTQRVTGKPLKEFKKIKHTSRMLSLEDVFSCEEFSEWVERIQKLAKKDRFTFYAEPKFDGLALSIVYEDGFLHYAATRGDGEIGEDVTQNVRTIESVPLNISKKSRLEIRGEAMLTKKNFDEINYQQKKKGEKIYANSRNLVAGSIRQLDSSITSARKLDFFAYDLIVEKSDILSHFDEHEVLRSLGFKTGGEWERFCKTKNDVFEHYKYIESRREKLPYSIDGIVVSVNTNQIFEKLGVVGKAPRGAIAFKFSPSEAITQVEDILVQVGRTGALTPVAILKPIAIGGVTVSRATLHNEDEIKRLGLKIGDSAVIGRAGDVIPDIRKVLKELRSGREKEFHMPRHCPVCKSTVEKLQKEGVGLYCLNQNCSARHRENIYHFVSRKAFNIDGLGPKILNTLLDNGLIQDSADIFALKEGDISPLERFGEKSSKNIIKAIKSARKISLARFIYALGILHVGEETAIDLANYFGSLGKLEKANFEDLEKIQNIGGVVAKSVREWFTKERNKSLLGKLLKHIDIENPRYKKPGKLTNKTFVFTGEMALMSRDEAKLKIRELGGTPSETVGKNTDYIVVGELPGSKYTKAQKLGIKILNEKEFLNMLK